MKEITKEEFDLLLKNKVIFTTSNGVVDKNGFPVSYARTKHKLHIMDKYADLAQSMFRSLANGKEKT